MFEELVVRFETENGIREAVVPPGTEIRGVLLPGMGGPEEANRLGLGFVDGLAPGMIVRDGSGTRLSDDAVMNEGRLGICCIVAGDLHCW